jgi:uncharacterized protein YgiM (DUF1202 family)
MGNRHLCRGLLLLLVIVPLVGACQSGGGGYSAAPSPPQYYYVTPTTSYLRSCPSYGEECYVVAQVFSGDRVIVLDRNDYGWARVQLDRSGVTGWIPNGLLSYGPVPSSYYVAWNNVYMRNCADYNCGTVQLLYRGDRVDRLEEDYRGWWRVRAAKNGISGWIPAAAASPRPGPPYYYVAVSSLALRSGPSTGNRMLTSLSLNTQVEMLEMNAGGWAQVRDTRTGIIGWVAARYLESFRVSRPRPVHHKRAPAKKSKPSKEAPAPAPAKPRVM